MTDEMWRTEDIDLSDMSFWRRPWAERDEAFALLRTKSPISFFAEPVLESSLVTLPTGPGYWALTRHHDIVEVSRHPEVFLSGPGAVSILDLPPELVEYFSGMISTDNPTHARLRRIVSHAFNPRRIRAIEDSITDVASRLIDQALEHGTGDFVQDVAAPLPLTIICQMMGVPESEYATVLHCANVILSNGDPQFVPEGSDPILAFLDAGRVLTELMNELGARRLESPTDDLTSALLHATVEGERLNAQELASFFVLLVTAGSETTRTAIAHALWAFTQWPDQREKLVSDLDGTMTSAVEEIVRWASPVIWMRRTLASDYLLSGVALHAGDKVLMFYNSANRDEAVFDSPDSFDVTRTPNDHLGFGAAGPHFCLGAHLARREISVMWRELFTRLPNLRATSAPTALASSFINGVTHLAYEY